MAKKKVKKKTVKKKTAKKKAAKKKAPAKKASAKKAAKKVTKKKPVAKKKAAKKATKKKVTKKAAVKKKATKKVAKKAAKKATKKVAKKAPAKKVAKKAPAKAPGKAKKETSKKAKEKAKVVEVEEAFEEEIEFDDIPEASKPEEEIVLTDAEGRRYCRVKDCDQVAMVDGYCRYHYLLHWKKIQVRKKILSEGKLDKYIEELTARYPDKYLDILRADLASEKNFVNVVHELQLDENSEVNEEEFDNEVQRYNEEVQGIVSGSDSDNDRDDDY